MNKRVARFGVAFASKELGIHPSKVDFVPSVLLGQTTITAMFLPDHNTILFNENWLEGAKPEEVLMIAFHETRHAYQKRQIDVLRFGLNIEPTEVVQRWKTEFERYYRAKDEFQSDPMYLEQGVEKDAIEYSQKTIEIMLSTISVSQTPKIHEVLKK